MACVCQSHKKQLGVRPFAHDSLRSDPYGCAQQADLRFRSAHPNAPATFLLANAIILR